MVHRRAPIQPMKNNYLGSGWGRWQFTAAAAACYQCHISSAVTAALLRWCGAVQCGGQKRQMYALCDNRQRQRKERTKITPNGKKKLCPTVKKKVCRTVEARSGAPSYFSSYFLLPTHSRSFFSRPVDGSTFSTCGYGIIAELM